MHYDVTSTPSRFNIEPPGRQNRTFRNNTPNEPIRSIPLVKTFSIQTLGCKVNQYESKQIATLLRSRGLLQVDRSEPADLRVVNTCSVTTEAASKSRQTVRRTTRLPVLVTSPKI